MHIHWSKINVALYLQASYVILSLIISCQNDVLGEKVRVLKSPISNSYSRNRATFDPSDELVLNDGVLFDARMGKEIRLAF